MTITIVSSCGRASALVDHDIDPWLLQRPWALAGFPRRYFHSADGYLHRLVIGAPEDSQVDHINGDSLDDRRANLRLATQSQNMANRAIPAGQVRGVRLQSGGHWHARLTVNGKELQLGSYATQEEAARARDIAAREHFGEFAHLNMPEAEGPGPTKIRSAPCACAVCGTPFAQVANGSPKRYCGKRCAQKAADARWRERRRVGAEGPVSS